MQSITKPCTRCGAEQPLDNYQRDRSTKDGRRAYCKACAAAYARSERGKANFRRYARTDKGKQRSKRASHKYNKSERGRARNSRYQREHRPQYAAKEAVKDAIGSGRLPHPSTVPCEGGSGCDGRHEWHHDSYRREDRLRVRCYCIRHHRQWHRANDPDPFDG